MHIRTFYHWIEKGLLDASVYAGDDRFKQQREEEVVGVGKMECQTSSPPLTTQVYILYIHVYVHARRYIHWIQVSTASSEYTDGSDVDNEEFYEDVSIYSYVCFNNNIFSNVYL